MIALALVLAQVVAQHGPWEQYQKPNPYTQFDTHVLILRWGDGAPIALHYRDLKACQAAAIEVETVGDAYAGPDGRSRPAPSAMSGPNQPHAFCIPG